ncbi:2532_t:CDS:1, partial [Acaulospora colombiana]
VMHEIEENKESLLRLAISGSQGLFILFDVVSVTAYLFAKVLFLLLQTPLADVGETIVRLYPSSNNMERWNEGGFIQISEYTISVHVDKLPSPNDFNGIRYSFKVQATSPSVRNIQES